MALTAYFIKSSIVTTFGNCLIYLVGMFLYDCFWVFGSDVMTTVATELVLPIKLQFPLTVDGQVP